MKRCPNLHFSQTARIAWCTFKHDVHVMQRGDICMEIDHKCAYGPCQCKVGQMDEYCSDNCRDAEKLRGQGTQCSCGHEECTAAQSSN